MELLEKLLELPCPAGFEKQGNAQLKFLMDNLFDTVEEDALGNLTGYIFSREEDAPTVMLCAHYDSIGLIVSEIKENGFVKFAPVGGVDERVLPGSEVIIHGSERVYGIIGIRPPHILTAEDMKKPESCKTLAIDTGMPDDKLKEIVNIGTPVTFRNVVREMGDNISSGTLDDRVGCWAVLRAAEELRKNPLGVNLCVMLSAQEELGRCGAKAGSYNIRPDIAVVVDATFGKTPECGAFTAKCGEGPVLCKGPVLNRRYTKILENIAKEKEIPYQVEVEGGDPGTDAMVIETSGGGVPCVMVSFPLKYMHTGIETVSSRDMENTVKLLKEFVEAAGDFLC